MFSTPLEEYYHLESQYETVWDIFVDQRRKRVHLQLRHPLRPAISRNIEMILEFGYFCYLKPSLFRL